MRRAIVLGLIFAVGLGAVGAGRTLGGSWGTKVIFDMTGGPWPVSVDVTSELVIEYILGDWTFSSESKIDNGLWTDQDVKVAGVLGAFAISGFVEFDPPFFPYGTWARLSVDLTIAGVSFGAEVTLLDDGAGLKLTGSGAAGDVSIDVEIRLGEIDACDFDFTEARIDVGFPFCCADVSFHVQVSCEAWFWAGFSVEGITIHNLPWLTLGARAEFGVIPPGGVYDVLFSAKMFTLEPEIDLGIIACDFDLYYRLVSEESSCNSGFPFPHYDPMLIDGIVFDGIEIACDIGGVQFTGITYFGTGIWVEDGYAGPGYYLPGILYHYEGRGFFEAYQIATSDDTCCGPFSFDVTVFFEEGGLELFDVSYVVANMEIQLATQFTFGMGIETDLELETVNDLSFTFLVEW